MASIKVYHMVLDEFGFGPEKEDGRRIKKSKRWPGYGCHAFMKNGKIRLQGVGENTYDTWYINVQGEELRQLLRIIIKNHI